MTRRTLASLALALAVALSCALFFGCSPQSDSQASTDGLPELVIGSDIYEPFVSLGDDGAYAGIDVELATEACRRIGYKPVFKTIDWDNKNSILESGQVDCLWGSFTMTGREDNYRWAGPYMYSRQVVVVRGKSGISSLSDLAGKRVGVQVSSIPEGVILKGDDPRVSEVGKVYSFSALDEMYVALRKDYVDAICGHEGALRLFVDANPAEYTMLDESLFLSEVGVAFSKNYAGDVPEKLSSALADMAKDGTSAAILSSYGIDAEKALGGGIDEPSN